LENIVAPGEGDDLYRYVTPLFDVPMSDYLQLQLHVQSGGSVVQNGDL